jgi:hypothetical protein
MKGLQASASHLATESRDLERVLSALAELSGDASVATSVQEVLDRIVRFAAEAIPGCVEAAVMITAPRLVASTRPRAQWVAKADLMRDGTQRISAQNGVVIELTCARHSRGVLALYGDLPGAVSVTSPSVIAFARCAELAINRGQALEHEANLRKALQTSRDIGTALGIVMMSDKSTSEQAFARMRALSQRHHCKIRDLATEIVLSGELPDEGSLRHRRSPSAADRRSGIQVGEAEDRPQ